jgi:hypothetical protein
VEALLDRPDARALLAWLPPVDILGMVKEVGLADCLELLEICPPRALQGLLDLGAWTSDRVDPRQLAAFYAALFSANPETAVEQVLGTDMELYTLFLKLHTRVVCLADEPEPEDHEDGITTPDGKYAVVFVDGPALPEEAGDPLGLGERGRALAREAAKQLVNGLISRDPGVASKVIDAMRWELPSPLEEEAMRWRAGRLADMGFPPRQEALKLLGYLDPDTPALAPAVMHAPPPPGEGVVDNALSLYVDPDDGAAEPFLRAALATLDDVARERFRRELATVCNRLAVARAAPPGDPDAMAGVVREARVTCDLGLAYRCGGEPSRAAALLHAVSLADLYRVGNSLGLKLQREARKVACPGRGDARLLCRALDAPGGLALAALLGRQPLFFVGLEKAGELATRPFGTLEDLALAARSLASSAFRLAVALDVLGVSLTSLEEASLQGTNYGSAAELTLEVLLTTALVRAACGGHLSATPLGAADLAPLRAALESDSQVAQAGHALADVVGPRAPLPGARDQEEARQRALALSTLLLERLRDEVKGVPSQKPLDGRFLTRVLARVG